MKMPSTTRGQHNFAQVPRTSIPRSVFNRNHGYKTTFDAGWLVPIDVDEVLPGDTIKMDVALFARLATPLKPIMDNIHLDYFVFFVPYRLIWDNFEKFFGAQTNPGDSTSFTVPINSPYTPALMSLSDYMAIPIGLSGTVHSMLPFRAYNLIWNQWFRDQNLQNSVTVNTGDGPDSMGNYVLLKRGKRHDYFTSCLPAPQRGAAVLLPLGTSAPIVSQGTAYPKFKAVDGSPTGGQLETSGGTSPPVSVGGTWGIGDVLTWDQIGLTADLAGATAATVNQIRTAFQVQRIYEKDARGGTRYTESVRAHFDVVSPDARLQRPEYLGGGTVAVNVSPIAQNSAVPSQPTPQGNLAGIGTASHRGRVIAKSFTEHGVLMTLISARADLSYQQGMERQWNRRTRFDFYVPSLAHLGEQAVLNKEIYWQGGVAADELVFGYQERFGEMRYRPSFITGLFRSQAAGTIDIWHLAQRFTVLPTLNATFIQEDPPLDRVIAVPTEPHFLLDAYFTATWARPMPVFGVPGLIDHF